MKYLKIITFFLFIAILSSCVIDSFEFMFSVRNDSKKTIRIYFSQNPSVDTTVLFKEYAIVNINSDYYVYKDLIFERKQYKKTNKKLYMFIFDENKIEEMKKMPGNSLTEIATASLLKRDQIDILNITKSDTVFYKGIQKNEDL